MPGSATPCARELQQPVRYIDPEIIPGSLSDISIQPRRPGAPRSWRPRAFVALLFLAFASHQRPTTSARASPAALAVIFNSAAALDPENCGASATERRCPGAGSPTISGAAHDTTDCTSSDQIRPRGLRIVELRRHVMLSFVLPPTDAAAPHSLPLRRWAAARSARSSAPAIADFGSRRLAQLSLSASRFATPYGFFPINSNPAFASHRSRS